MGALKETPPLTLTGLVLLSATVRRVAPSPRGRSSRTDDKSAGNWTRAETDLNHFTRDDHVDKTLINRYGIFMKLFLNVKYVGAHLHSARERGSEGDDRVNIWSLRISQKNVF